MTGFGIKNGAVAQTIGHDNHNITVLGTSAEDMALAVNSLGKDGGIAVVIDGKLKAEMPLPIAGLMSDKPYEEAVKEYIAINEKGSKAIDDVRQEMEKQMEALNACISNLQKALASGKGIRPAMENLRKNVDELEGMIDDSVWPMPKYREMLFIY